MLVGEQNPGPLLCAAPGGRAADSAARGGGDDHALAAQETGDGLGGHRMNHEAVSELMNLMIL